jgi:hypothetical protein
MGYHLWSICCVLRTWCGSQTNCYLFRTFNVCLFADSNFYIDAPQLTVGLQPNKPAISENCHQCRLTLAYSWKKNHLTQSLFYNKVMKMPCNLLNTVLTVNNRMALWVYVGIIERKNAIWTVIKLTVHQWIYIHFRDISKASLSLSLSPSVHLHLFILKSINVILILGRKGDRGWKWAHPGSHGRSAVGLCPHLRTV